MGDVYCINSFSYLVYNETNEGLKITKNGLINGTVEKIVEGVMVIFGLYLLFQVLRKVFGGSWSTEDLILGLLIFNLGCTFTIGLMVTQIKSDQSHLKGQFKSLAGDFKRHVKK